MKRLMIVVTALVVVSFLACPFVQARGVVQDGHLFVAAAAVGPQGPRGGATREGVEGRRPGRPGHVGRLIERLIMTAVAAPWAKDDAELQGLVDQGIADRRTMINSESACLTAFENLVKGIRAGKSKEELKPEIDALKAAREKLREDTKKLRDDLKAIRDRLKELRPERTEGAEGAQAWGEGRARGERRARGRKPNADDFPPVIE